MEVAKQRAAVLVGGVSAEREVSLSSGKMVMEALDSDRYDAFRVDTGTQGWINSLLDGPRPDVALIILHGPGGEDGSVQGLLQTAGIPFTGSGVLASALCMDKELTKLVLRAEGLPVPKSVVVTRKDLDRPDFAPKASELPLPLIVKPNRQGSTLGTTLVSDGEKIAAAVEEALRFDTQVLLEEFVTGTEITVCVVGGEVPETLPVVEIVPQSGFYDYHDKYTPGATDEIVPARIPEARAEEARRYALAAHRRLKCWGMSRTDMIVGERQTWILEVNTIPGMAPTSLLPRAAAAAGMTLSMLLDRLIELAKERPEG